METIKVWQGVQVSVLFSEPKIPQLSAGNDAGYVTPCFSALQRAENSSIDGIFIGYRDYDDVSVLFSEPKIPQFEPRIFETEDDKFQCSSASRKFLNGCGFARGIRVFHVFQCSSASRKFLNPDPRTCVHPYFRPR